MAKKVMNSPKPREETTNLELPNFVAEITSKIKIKMDFKCILLLLSDVLSAHLQ